MVDANYGLVSITVQLKGPNMANIPYEHTQNMKALMLKSACALTDKKLLNETDYKLRMRFLKPAGGVLMSVEASGKTCANS